MFQQKAVKKDLLSLRKLFEVTSTLFGCEMNLNIFKGFLSRNDLDIRVFKDYVASLKSLEKKHSKLFAKSEIPENEDSFEKPIEEPDTILFQFLLLLENGNLSSQIHKQIFSKRIDEEYVPEINNKDQVGYLRELCFKENPDEDAQSIRQLHQIQQRIQKKQKQKNELLEILFKETGINISKANLDTLINEPEVELKEIMNSQKQWKQLFHPHEESFEEWSSYLQCWARKHLNFIYSELFLFEMTKESYFNLIEWV
jgi:hypothetical protein